MMPSRSRKGADGVLHHVMVGNIERVMSRLSAGYALWSKRKHRRHGHVEKGIIQWRRLELTGGGLLRSAVELERGESMPCLPMRKNSGYPLRQSVIPLTVVIRLQRNKGVFLKKLIT